MRDLPRWAWMWGLALVIYAACKALTWSTANAAQAPRWKQAAYLLAWPGMDPAAFLESNVVISCCLAADWVRATLNLVLGTFLVLLSARIVPAIGVYLSGWIGMAGLVLILHFGTFHVLSCAWRGFNCRANPLMNRPLASTSLAEFWGRRWNTAFRDLTHRWLFRPLRSRVGPRWAVLAGFAFSGLVHDLVISVPAGGGYGRPTLFFVIQGLAITAERSRSGQRIGLGRGVIGRVFVWITLVAPLGLLFHRPFVVGIIAPFIQAIGALS